MTDATTVDAESASAYMQLVRAATDSYRELGWTVIPILVDTKKPAMRWAEWQQTPPSDEEVGSWFSAGVPDGSGATTTFFGIGILTGAKSGLVVLDCDNAEALAFAVSEAGLWSPLGAVTTRGQHLYFRHPGSEVRNKAGGIGLDWPSVQGLDLRGDGGYVVAPPTIKFGGDGKPAHQYAWTIPDAELTDAFFALPAWPGMPVSVLSETASARVEVPLDAAGELSLENLRLDGVRSYGASVWDEAGRRIRALGRGMSDGDGRNAWLTRYVGECLSGGMSEPQAVEASKQFCATFFATQLPEREHETVLKSVISIDKRRHPERYEPAPGYKSQTPERAKRANAIRLITPSTLAKLRELTAGARYLIDPYIAPESITQVVGFNGHGKTLFLLNMLYAAARGESFGAATVERALRVLYLDFESSGNTLSARITQAEDMLGPMPENMIVWAKSVASEQISFTDDTGVDILRSLLDECNPQIVVIDTVREAWLGMEENSPHAWVKVNQLALAIRNSGRSVILVHHRNKPNAMGIGREAGSTAQLKDLDTQVFITKVIEDTEQAKREAAIDSANTAISDAAGRIHTAHSYLRGTLPPGFRLSVVFEASFGKVRQASENHGTQYFGIATHMTTGSSKVVSTLSPRQKAALLLRRGGTVASVADQLGIPGPTISNWTKDQA